MHTKIALNRLQELLRRNALSPSAVARVDGAEKLQNTLQILKGKLYRKHPVLIPSLQRMRAASRTASREAGSPLERTPRRLAIEALRGRLKAKQNDVRETRWLVEDGSLGAYIAPTEPSTVVSPEGSLRARTIERLREKRIATPDLAILPSESNPGWLIRKPVNRVVNMEGTGVAPKDGRRVRAYADGNIVEHELGEAEAFRAAMSGASDGIIPFDTHYHPDVLLREHATSTPGGSPERTTTLLEDTPLQRTNAEAFLSKVIRNVRPSIDGSFPLHGRHAKAVAERMADYVANNPKASADRVSALWYALQGVPLHPKIEAALQENFEKPLRGVLRLAR